MNHAVANHAPPAAAAHRTADRLPSSQFCSAASRESRSELSGSLFCSHSYSLSSVHTPRSPDGDEMREVAALLADHPKVSEPFHHLHLASGLFFQLCIGLALDLPVILIFLLLQGVDIGRRELTGGAATSLVEKARAWHKEWAASDAAPPAAAAARL